MIYIHASHYCWYTSDTDAAYAFTSFLESMGYTVTSKVTRTENEFPVTSIISMN